MKKCVGQIFYNSILLAFLQQFQSLLNRISLDSIVFKVLLITYKALNDLAPSYICDLVKVYVPKKDLRSQHEYRLDPPKTKLKTYGDSGFEAASAKEWTILPLDIKLAPSLDSFKTNLKTHLFRLHYKIDG